MNQSRKINLVMPGKGSMRVGRGKDNNKEERITFIPNWYDRQGENEMTVGEDLAK